MLRVEQVGGLAVAWNPTDQRTVQRELSRLSPTLFIDPELDPEHGVYWTVKDNSSMPPLCVLVWRDGDGTAKPLTLGIVEQVKRQEGAMDGAVDQMVKNLERQRDRRREQAEETYREMERDHRARIRSAELDSLPPFWRPKRFGAGA